jgi:hypothetical protein
MPYTRDEILALLHEESPRGDRAVERALLVLLDRQTTDEQRTEQTKHHNLRGFMPFDAKKMTSMAKQVQSSRREKGQKLSPRQRAWLRSAPPNSRYPSRIGKYARQLALVANEKAAPQQLDLPAVA